MTTEIGRVSAVNTIVAGSELAADVPVGATTITVVDPADFSDYSGYLILNDETLAYAFSDDETGIITLTDPTTVASLSGDPVQIWDPSTSDVAQETIALVALVGSPTFNDDTLEAVVDHGLIPYLAEGIRGDDDGETVVLEWRGSQVRVVDLLDQSPSLSSTDAGWTLDSSGASFNTLSVDSEIGADIVTASSITLGGRDLESEIINFYPQGVIAQATLGNSTTDTASVSAATLMAVFTAGSLSAGRVYKITYGAPVNGTVTGDFFYTRVYYTLDGTTPIIGGLGIMDGSICPVSIVAGQTVLGEHAFYYYPTSDVGTLKLGFVLVRVAGTGTAKYVMSNTNLPFYVSVEDAGDASTVVGSLSQKSKATGTVDPTDPPATYTRSWSATWTQSYDGDGTKRAGDADTPDLYQGYYSGTHRNTKSMIGFDDAAIRSALSGATLKSIKFTFRVKHSYQNAGMTVRIRTHNSSNVPSTWSTVDPVVASKTSAKEGVTYTVSLPLSVATGFANGTIRGIAFGPGDTTSNVYYGYMYGGTSSSRPKLTITYSK